MSRVNRSVVQNVDIQPKKQKSFPCQVSGISTVVLPSSLPLSPHPLSLAKAYEYGKQSTAGYDSDEGCGATGYSYYSTPYTYEDEEESPVISGSDEEEEENEMLENLSIDDSTH